MPCSTWRPLGSLGTYFEAIYQPFPSYEGRKVAWGHSSYIVSLEYSKWRITPNKADWKHPGMPRPGDILLSILVRFPICTHRFYSQSYVSVISQRLFEGTRVYASIEKFCAKQQNSFHQLIIVKSNFICANKIIQCSNQRSIFFISVQSEITMVKFLVQEITRRIFHMKSWCAISLSSFQRHRQTIHQQIQLFFYGQHITPCDLSGDVSAIKAHSFGNSCPRIKN